MKKTVGSLRVETTPKIDRDSQITITKNYNPDTSESIRLDGIEDIEDLEYILQGLKFKIKRRENE